MKKINKKICFGALATVLTVALLAASLTYLPVHGEERIYDAVIRLHVLANSDSEQDQALKLKVRDAVLATVNEQMGDCTDRAQAQARLEQLIPTLIRTAEQVVAEEGGSQRVQVTLTREQYPTRNYESFCFPAGDYLSLRVMLGEAQGQNFWCVLFPPLCMSAASVGRAQAEEEFISVGLTKDQYGIITQSGSGKYKLRFRILELLRGGR